VASIDIAFGAEDDQAGVYHSAYDTFEHYDRFGDPGFAYGVVMAKTGGRLVLRAADAELAPLRYADAADMLGENLDQLHKLADTMRQRTTALNAAVDAKAFDLAFDPTHHWRAPDKEDPVPAIEFGRLDQAVAKLKASAKAFDAAAADVGSAKPAALAKVNVLLQGMEQTLTDARGLPGRPWYQNLAYAPGVLTGYGAKTLPGVREAIEGRRWAEAVDYINRTADALTACSQRLDEATAQLRS
jgi:N-acetylated-alpha-linked acidic dipeptidase